MTPLQQQQQSCSKKTTPQKNNPKKKKKGNETEKNLHNLRAKEKQQIARKIRKSVKKICGAARARCA
jgi:hypothetical protein